LEHVHLWDARPVAAPKNPARAARQSRVVPIVPHAAAAPCINHGGMEGSEARSESNTSVQRG